MKGDIQWWITPVSPIVIMRDHPSLRGDAQIEVPVIFEGVCATPSPYDGKVPLRDFLSTGRESITALTLSL